MEVIMSFMQQYSTGFAFVGFAFPSPTPTPTPMHSLNNINAFLESMRITHTSLHWQILFMDKSSKY
jgi:hypothetical protein